MASPLLGASWIRFIHTDCAPIVVKKSALAVTVQKEFIYFNDDRTEGRNPFMRRRQSPLSRVLRESETRRRVSPISLSEDFYFKFNGLCNDHDGINNYDIGTTDGFHYITFPLPPWILG
jgi:hypothetical protein